VSVIEFRDVTKTYPGRGGAAGTTAVSRLSLRIESGSVTAFVGPSGCGKTTSMRMINRMISPSSGTITVAGKDIAAADPVKLRLGIGYVIQSGGLLAALTLLERVGLDPALAARYPAQLSGGQQQRVGVARALAADPPILLMDEPFSAVDPVVREDLQAEMQRLQAELRKTIVIVTHDLDEAVKLGDRVAVFGPGGTLQQYDAPQLVLSTPATDFVADFVGRDRGYRGLSFRDANDIGLQDIQTTTQDSLTGLQLQANEWALIVDAAGAPRGWIDATGVAAVSAGHEVAESISAGGSLFPPGGDLRQALDAAISSPSGIGVAVDTSGAVIGGFAASDVIGQLARQRGSEDHARNQRLASETGPS